MYKQKYLKYKTKYINLKKLNGGQGEKTDFEKELIADINPDEYQKILIDNLDSLMEKKLDNDIPNITLHPLLVDFMKNNKCNISDKYGQVSDMSCGPVDIKTKFLDTGILPAEYMTTYKNSPLHAIGNLIENNEIIECGKIYLNGFISCAIFGYTSDNFRSNSKESRLRIIKYKKYTDTDQGLIILKKIYTNMKNTEKTAFLKKYFEYKDISNLEKSKTKTVLNIFLLHTSIEDIKINTDDREIINNILDY
jgi:hypothetical protein